MNIDKMPINNAKMLAPSQAHGGAVMAPDATGPCQGIAVQGAARVRRKAAQVDPHEAALLTWLGEFAGMVFV